MALFDQLVEHVMRAFVNFQEFLGVLAIVLDA